MLKKLLAIILISFIFISFSHSDEFIDTINELVVRLEESTKVIQDLTEENKELRKQLTEYQGTDIEQLVQERKELIDIINNLTERLEESTDLIVDLSNQIKDDQKEVENLRTSIETLLGNYENSSLFNLQLGATMPLGAQVAIDFRIPRLPIGLYATAGVMTNESQIADITGVNVYVGGGIRFGL